MTIVVLSQLDVDGVRKSAPCISVLNGWRQTFVVASYPNAVVTFYDRTAGLPVEKIGEATVATPEDANAVARAIHWPEPYLEVTH